MSDAPSPSVITIDRRAIEYRLERRRDATALILHGAHVGPVPVRRRNLHRGWLLGAGGVPSRIWPDCY
jgi:hypothetical protein